MKKISLIVVLMIAVSLVFADLPEHDSFMRITVLNQNPDPVMAGDTFEVSIGIENLGGAAAENYVIEIIPEYPFELAPGESGYKDLGTIYAYQYGNSMKTATFELKVNGDAEEGVYELKFKEYEQNESSPVGRNPLNISVESEELVSVTMDKNEFFPGEQSQVKILLGNIGKSPIEDLTFSWENEDGVVLPFGTDNTENIDFIAVGETHELIFNVIVDSNAAPGSYKLNFVLDFEDSDTQTSSSGIYIGGDTDFEVLLSDDSDGQYSFTIANVGNNYAYSVVVSVPEQDGWQVSGASSEMLGNLDSGDYTISGFQLSNSGMKLSNKLILKIDYTNTKGKRTSIEKEITLNQNSLQQNYYGEDFTNNSSSGPWANGQMPTSKNFQSDSLLSIALGNPLLIVGLGIVILASGFFIYKKYRKKSVR